MLLAMLPEQLAHSGSLAQALLTPEAQAQAQAQVQVQAPAHAHAAAAGAGGGQGQDEVMTAGVFND